MNKLFTKIGVAIAGMTMAIGVGVSLGQNDNFREAKADGTARAYNEIVSGKKYFITATYNKKEYVLKAASFSAGGGSAVELDLAGLEESDAWTFTASSAKWIISTTISTNTYYLGVNNDNNGLKSTGDSFEWTAALGGAAGMTYLTTTDSGSNTRYMALYQGTNWRCYKNTSSGVPSLKLYEYSAPSKTVSSIAVTTQPTKTTYEEGETLDLSGVVITATWSDATTSNCTASALFSPANGAALASSDTTVTVTFGGKSTSISLTVNPIVFSTNDIYLTGEGLGLGTSYSNDDANLSIDGKAFKFGRTDVCKNKDTGTIQLKASTGKFYNKSKPSAAISKIYFMADADNANAPSNWAVYGSNDTAGSTTTSLQISTVDSTNRIYSVDFTGGTYYFFTVAKTGSYAIYFDMIVVELVHTADDVAAVRTAASNMLTTFAAFCSAGHGPSSEQWTTIAGYYSGLTDDQKAIFNACVLNAAPCNSGDAYGAPVQGTNLQKAVQKIEYCVQAYGVTNFTGREIAASRYVPTYVEMSTSNTVMIAVVISSAMVAILIGGYFFIRRRKEK